GALAEKVLGVESADVETGWHALFAGGELPERAGKLLAGAHSIVSFVSGADDAWSRNVRRLAPQANLLTLSPNPPSDFAGHATDHLIAQLAAWPAAEEAVRQILRSIASRGISVPRPAADQIVIHPGSGSPRKCWPM